MPLSSNFPRAAYFLGHTTSSDYLDFLYREFRAEAVELVLAHLRSRYHVKTCVFDRMLADSPSAGYLATRPGAQVTHEDAVAIDIPDSRAAFDRLLTKRFRQNVRTAINRAEKDGVELSIAINTQLSEDDIRTVRHMRRQRALSRQSQRTPSDSVRSIVRRWAVWGHHDSVISLLSLQDNWNVTVRRSDGQLIAIAAGLRDRRHDREVVRVNLVSYDESYSRYSPGIVALHAFIVEAIEDGDGPQVLDLTRGQERYKADLGGRPHSYASVSVQL
ncbi:GNAT family N-acetyltransferase [Nostocoides sp. F2B08]|uniref:GNAT family N-acetyltransferase n=1 Tax=Nostocoides sp. F2B08 TaxID=2653936 RepID=UPI00186B1CDC|nr:GNAT family N-acetyltransferase [Tetrasphaera sp. F2B08]